MQLSLVSCGAGRSSINRRTSARRAVSGTPRPTVTRASVSAPPGLTTDSLYFFTTSAFRFLYEYIGILVNLRKQPPGAGRVGTEKADAAANLAVAHALNH